MVKEARTPKDIAYADKLVSLIAAIPETKRSAYDVIEALLIGAAISEKQNKTQGPTNPQNV